MDDAITARLAALKEKYSASGQELLDFLDGLLEADYLTYWDYIRLDSLLSLQQPRTSHHDEPIFIMYHQITELYFKLVLHELDPIIEKGDVSADVLAEAMRRCNRYFSALEHSFGVMVDGMDREQFLRFRMALIPASGFQSGQYRMIELASANLHDLVHLEQREAMRSEESVEALLAQIYWLRGATIEKDGQKTLTLVQFETHYGETFLKRAKKAYQQSISSKKLYLSNSKAIGSNTEAYYADSEYYATKVLKAIKDQRVSAEHHNTNLEWITELMKNYIEQGYKVSLTESLT